MKAPKLWEITAEGLSIPEIGVGSPSFVLYAAVVQMETTPRYGGPGSSPGGGDGSCVPDKHRKFGLLAQR